MAKLQLRANVPEVIALQFPNGKEVPSEYNGTEILYSLSDGRSWYVHPSVARKVDALSLGKGEPFEVTKVEAPNGAKGFTYEVKHFAGGATNAPALAAPVMHPSAAPLAVQSQQRGTTPEVGPLQTNPNSSAAQRMMASLASAIDAVTEAQEYATRKGLRISFTAEDVRAISNTLYIDASKGAR